MQNYDWGGTGCVISVLPEMEAAHAQVSVKGGIGPKQEKCCIRATESARLFPDEAHGLLLVMRWGF